MAVAVLLRQRALSSPHAVSCRNGSYYLERLDPWALRMIAGRFVCSLVGVGCHVFGRMPKPSAPSADITEQWWYSLYSQVISSITMLCFISDCINEQLEKAIIFLLGCYCCFLFSFDEYTIALEKFIILGTRNCGPNYGVCMTCMEWTAECCIMVMLLFRTSLYCA